MSRGRLDEKICWYEPKKDSGWSRKEMIRKGFKKRTLVLVRDHTYEGEDGYGGISNWVTFSRVSKSGFISTDTDGMYDYGQFTVAKEFTSQTKVVRNGFRPNSSNERRAEFKRKG